MVINLKEFKDDYLKNNRGTKVKWQDYYYIINCITSAIIEDIFSGKSFNFPYKLGSIRVLKYKTKKVYIDWVNTKKYGKYIYHKNFHSDGYQYKVFWDKSESKLFRNKFMYGFKLLRVHSRKLAKGIKENKYEFLS